MMGKVFWTERCVNDRGVMSNAKSNRIVNVKNGKCRDNLKLINQ